MSVRTMTKVWALDLPDSEKIVLLALADCANDEGHCWPSVRSLMVKCSKSERTIQGCIKRLVDAGHLTRREVLGKGCNYTVHPRSDDTPAENAPPQRTTQTPAAAADKPSVTVNSEAKASSQRVIEAWNEMAKKAKLPEVRVLDASRRQSLRLRLKDHGETTLIEAIGAIGRNAWLRGEGRDSNWRPDFDFFLSPAKLRKVIEGSYGPDGEQDRARLSPIEQAKAYSERADFLRSINRPDDAADWDRKAAALRCGSMAGAAPIGSLAKNFLEGVRS